jgi:sec-independent protein translocase protein TatA
MLEGSDLLIVAVIVLLLFGGSQLPKLARSLGEAQRELKKAMSDDAKGDKPPTPDADKLNGKPKS